MELKDRMTKLINKLKYGLHERDEIISVVLLSALAEQNIFLFGPPGTAKSLISRRLSKAFKTENYFEHLMQRFSTPEEVFGPISISELKKDNYLRKIEGFLPDAEFAFLDEIWKSSPAILNTLLTIINEKVFKNGTNIEKVPLKVLIAASNETPPENQGLDALYDRFLTRLYVPPLQDRNNFETILQQGSTLIDIELGEELIILNSEWESWKRGIKKVKLSVDTFNIINGIRLEFEKRNIKKPFIYVSDRRWQQAAFLLKASAYFCDRDETNIADCLLLGHCLWSIKDNRSVVYEIVENVIKTNGFDTGVSLLQFDKSKEQLEKEINKELFYTEDVYKTKEISGKDYFEYVEQDDEEFKFYIPVENMKTSNEFNPIDENGNEYDWIICNFDKQGVCSVKVNYRKRDSYYTRHNDNYWENNDSYQPTILFHKGDRKINVNKRLINAFNDEIDILKDSFKDVLEQIKRKKEILIDELSTPFIPDEKLNITIMSVDKQIEELSLRIKDCDRLSSLVGPRIGVKNIKPSLEKKSKGTKSKNAKEYKDGFGGGNNERSIDNKYQHIEEELERRGKYRSR